MDRRFVLAIVLMMVVFVVPPLFIKRPAPRPAATPPAPPTAVSSAQPPAAPPAIGQIRIDSGAPVAEDTVTVSSPLYRYSFSTRGGRLLEADFLGFRSMRPNERDRSAQIIASESDLLRLSLLRGGDTLSFGSLDFQPATLRLELTADEPEGRTISFTARRDSLVGVDIEYTFVPRDYRIEVSGTVRGVGPTGATLLVGLGPGPRNTESDSVEHARELAVVTRAQRSELHSFSALDPGVPVVLSGPFQWVAVKSKYFVTALIAADSGPGQGGRIGGVQMVSNDRIHRTPEAADLQASLNIGADGRFRYSLYVGPMEYPRLRAIGYGFDDTNPYGWAWLQPVIRPVAVGARWLLVAFHEKAGIAYGLGLVIFGILIRIVLWPLNQKAMRASMAMQAIQPQLKEIQDRYQNEPQRLQQEMFKLYKENKVNPFSGCWPLLLPWPIMIALFFVFQNSIELRGQSFLWIPDLSRPDPIFVIPVLMALSMYGVTKIGQIGLPPNPQMKMMLYMMPAMMLILFLNFASGLNLYYAVQNIASIPQQWWIAKERLRKHPPPPPAPAAPPASRPKK
ncbi:MAG: membrane protein insertase YidC [Gemmatimonadetes bacterium]|nr:membrane protein insertase YidC [Gemmatimonadota bacterium]